ncbi:MAG: HAMP domain-containing histidine kinase [Deltaproteobacteria bacterium]|nr:HAMP domain-containing histidine kinase [Deltaproteobacteria bacterium]
MLYEFIESNRERVIERARGAVASRPWPVASPEELSSGIPLFLTQLTETLRAELGPASGADERIGPSAARHGRDLLARGFTFSQVVHDYGDVCQSITGLAAELQAPITTEEFHTLNRCLDTAIAESVTEFARLREAATADVEAERRGHLTHELGNKLHSAMLAFDVLKSGAVGTSGSTGKVLGSSLLGLRELLDTSIAQVRLASKEARRDRVKLKAFLEELAVSVGLYAGYREVTLQVDPVDPAREFEADLPLLASAVTNLLQNACKYTRPRSRVTLRTRSENGAVFIEVEDQCGGLDVPPGVDLFDGARAPHGEGRSGLGLGLSICRKAVERNRGRVRFRNLPGRGCIFEIELPHLSPGA